MRIALIHLHLGFGGAETVLINFALAAQKKGHDVTVYGGSIDPAHAFPEFQDGTIKYAIPGDWFPRSFFGKGAALCTAIRLLIACWWLVLFGPAYDCYVVDQLALCVPILRLTRKKVMMYCHFPDSRLDHHRTGFFKRIYLFFSDLLDEFATGCANKLLCNSEFTRQTFLDAFRILRYFKVKTQVMYPAINLSIYDNIEKTTDIIEKKIQAPYFFSLNRYDPCKNLPLAVKAWAAYRKKYGDGKDKLVIAGGSNKMLPEVRQCLQDLQKLAADFKLTDQIVFLFNLTVPERAHLLRNAMAVLYTPDDEHFGVVPLEGMYVESPVIACNTGGPLESVVDGKTGFLVKSEPELWADAFKKISEDPEGAKRMGKQGRLHVIQKFGIDRFAQEFNQHIDDLVGVGQAPKKRKEL